MMNSNQRGPITPAELFNALMAADFKEIQCQDEATKIRQQRDILLQLIVQYENQIKKAHVIAIEEEKLIQLRQKLLAELELLRNQRAVIDSKIHEEITTLRVTPLEEKDQQAWIIELNEYIARNNKLRIRIKDLMIYIEKLQLQNRRLEEERKIVQVNEMQRRVVGEDWRVKIQTLQKQQLSYEQQIKLKIKQKEQRTLREVQAQQFEIRQRNQRRRAQTLAGKPLYIPRGGQIHSRYVRQV